MAQTKKHRFKRQESWRYTRIPEAWRRPRGVTSRMRKEKKGWPQKVKAGFGTKSTTRGLHPRGLVERLVSQPADLDGLDPKIHIVRLSSHLGERKRLVILDKLKQINIRIANPGKVGETQQVGEKEPASEQPPSQEAAVEPTETAEGEAEASSMPEEPGS